MPVGTTANRGAPRSESKISMLAGGKHTLIDEDADPYISYLKQPDKAELI